jgi:S-adenosylmethionine decarboxylase
MSTSPEVHPSKVPDLKRQPLHDPVHSSATSETPRPPIGRHGLADLFGVDAGLLQDEAALMQLLESSLREHGFHVLDRTSHKFPGPGGVTGMALLSESHAAFHSYPEHHYLALDVFSCGMADPRPVIEAISAVLRPRRVQIHIQSRGQRIDDGGATPPA